MKRIRNSIAILIIGTTVFLASCAKEEESDARDKFVGSWTCNETSQQQGNSTYTMSVSKDVTSSNNIIAKNFYNLGNSTNTIMVIDGNNINIQSQVVSGYTINGSGTYSNGGFSLSFSADDHQTVDHATVSAHH